MTSLTRALLTALLLLTVAAPVAAVDEPTPEPVPAVEVSPVDPMPIEMTVADCAPELAVAVAAGETPIADAPCLLPDGTLYELAARGIDPAPNERGDLDPEDMAIAYEQWLAEFKASLEPCPEGTAPDAMDVATCVLADGTIVGPTPLFMGAPDVTIADDGSGDAEDIATTGAMTDEAGQTTALFAIGGILALGAALLFVRLRRSTR